MTSYIKVEIQVKLIPRVSNRVPVAKSGSIVSVQLIFSVYHLTRCSMILSSTVNIVESSNNELSIVLQLK